MNALDVYRFCTRARDKAFSLTVGRSLLHLGSHSVLALPVELDGARNIEIGDDVFIGAGSALRALDNGRITIGSGTSMSGTCVISSRASVTFGPAVLLAKNILVCDHSLVGGVAPRAQADVEPSPITIGEGAWLGMNTVVGPGVTIGRFAVVGANAVVTSDVPDHAIAIGNPARIARIYWSPTEVAS
jgi:acetyltransferase-like isoleucine patch superfamily enzyme